MIKLLPLLPPNILNEFTIGSAGSYWLNPSGNLLKVNNHYEYAIEWLNNKLNSTHNFPYEDEFTDDTTKSNTINNVFSIMQNLHFARVIIDNDINKISVYNPSSLNHKQLSSLKSLATELNYSIINADSNNTIFSPSDTL